ncbi:MAG TPA: cytochrome P450 [Herpetosiphonaceae bacterium]
MNAPLPPLLPGLPVVGNLVDFVRKRHETLRRGYETYGPVFAMKLGPQPVAVLAGPDHHQFFFKETDATLNIEKAYQFLAAMFGQVGFTASPEVYQRQRPVMMAPFQSSKMAGYVAVMAEETQRWLDGLGNLGAFEISKTMERLTLQIAAHALMGREFSEQVGPPFFELYRQLANGLDPISPPNWPLPHFIKRDRAKAKMYGILGEIIDQRRASDREFDDFLQSFIEARYRDGAPVERETITALVIALIFAGHETTAGQASWTIIELLRAPEYRGLVERERAEVLAGGRQLDLPALRQLKHLEWAAKEIERLHPSADILMRANNASYEVGGYHIPAGWNTMISPKLSHRLPEVFRDPERFDPLRFGPGREEDRKHQFTLIGFGGGIHKCPGMNFAYNEIKVIATMLMEQFDLELATRDPGTKFGLGAAHPTPTWVRYQRKAGPRRGAEPVAAAACPVDHSAVAPAPAEQSVEHQALVAAQTGAGPAACPVDHQVATAEPAGAAPAVCPVDHSAGVTSEQPADA